MVAMMIVTDDDVVMLVTMGAYGPVVRVFDGPWWARSNTRVCVPIHPRLLRGWRAHVPCGPLRHPAGGAGDLNPKLEFWLYVDFLQPPLWVERKPKNSHCEFIWSP